MITETKKVDAYVRKKLARVPIARTQGPVRIFYEITFIIDNKIKKFLTNEKTFSKIPDQTKGELTFKGARLIKFEGDGFCVINDK